MGTQSMVAQKDIIVRQEEYAVTVVITTIIITWTLKTKGDMTKMLMHRAYQTKAHI